MASHKIHTPDYTYYLETRKIWGKQAWKLFNKGVHVATLNESITLGGFLSYSVEFTDGSEGFSCIAPSIEKAVSYTVKHHGEPLRHEMVYALEGMSSASDERLSEDTEPYAMEAEGELQIWPIPDLADWPDSVLADNLAIYKAEVPDSYIEYRIAELTGEMERREALRNDDSEWSPASSDGTLSTSNTDGVVCPPLTIQFGEVGGLRLGYALEVESVLTAIADALAGIGQMRLAEHTRKLWVSGMAPINERMANNGEN